MSRPKFFRDPVHVQIRFENVNLAGDPPPADDAALRRSWLLRNLIDSPEFQRLRFVRQTGLANLVFHGAEHSRFSHSMGVAHLSAEMYDRIVRNMDEVRDDEARLMVSAAGLLHDVGHGPFSHTLEEILDSISVPFNHEYMTLRILEEDDSEVSQILRRVDNSLPNEVAAFIDKTRRTQDHWKYRLVSSQLDADRLDYLQRDAQAAGLRGHGFDLARLLDLLHHLDEKRIAVERGGIEAVEAYLVNLDQMYRAIYYHHAIRAANFVLTSVLRRATELHLKGDHAVFPPSVDGDHHPMQDLVELGQNLPLNQYVRLGEHHIWALIDSWRDSDDWILSDLSRRILQRDLFKTMPLDVRNIHEFDRVRSIAIDLVKEMFPQLDETSISLYVGVDEPSRTSYKQYDWRAEGADESIWMIGGGEAPRPIEDDQEGSRIAGALKGTMYFNRLVFPSEIREALNEAIENG